MGSGGERKEKMICPHCQCEQPDENSECPKCGIVFEKYFALQELSENAREEPQPSEVPVTDEEGATPPGSYLKELFRIIKTGL